MGLQGVAAVSRLRWCISPHHRHGLGTAHEVRRFGSFAHFHSLSRLDIDFDLFSPPQLTYIYTPGFQLPMQTRGLPSIITIRSFFSPHLSTFELGEVGWDTITRFYVYASMDMRGYILYMLTELVGELPIKKLTVTVGIPGLGDRYLDEVLIYLRRMADGLGGGRVVHGCV
jgi:hypothetical protein